MQNSIQGGLGVVAVERAVLGLGWFYRRQNEFDTGIDGHIEIIGADSVPSGLLIGVQVKSGPSYFREQIADCVVFRTDEKHAAYWSSHSLPVIVALHDPETDVVIWQSLAEENLESTGAGFKVCVPKSRRIDASCRGSLERLTYGTPREQKLARLAVDKPLMELVSREGQVHLLIDEWVNKSSGRGDFRIVSTSGDGETVLSEFMILAGPERYDDVVKALFPWAEVDIDEDFYEMYSENEECDEIVAFGSDEELAAYDGNSMSNRRIRPYDNVQNEVDRYRLTMELNSVGAAFLVIDAYLG